MEAASSDIEIKDPGLSIWAPCESVYVRWPHIGKYPNVLWEKARDSWVSKRDMTCRWYGRGGERLLWRSPGNKRAQQSTRRRIRAKMLTHGILQGLRSEPTCYPESDEIDFEWVKKFFVGAGHILDCFYDLDVQMPNHPQVVKMRELGFRGVTVIYHRTPDDGKTFYVSMLECFERCASRKH